jgi:hypothetical protein
MYCRLPPPLLTRQDAIEHARAAVGLEVQLRGALGIRTRFQTREIAQVRDSLDAAHAAAAAAHDQCRFGRQLGASRHCLA